LKATRAEARPNVVRIFGAWSMGCAGNAALFATLGERLTAEGAIDPARIDAAAGGPSAHMMFFGRRMASPATSAE
jgi:hypothetical protein